MKTRNLFIALGIAGLSVTSCIKDEAPNMECDITGAWLEVAKGPDGQDTTLNVFMNLTDTRAQIDGSLAATSIEFMNVRQRINSVTATLHIEATENSVVYGVSDDIALVRLADCTDTRAFVPGHPYEYFVVSEDQTAKYADATLDELYVASVAPGCHVRHYSIYLVKNEDSTTEFHFENYELNSTGKYYIWSDPLVDGSQRPAPNWATANGGYGMGTPNAKFGQFPTHICEGKVGMGVKLETCRTGAIATNIKKIPIAAGNLFLGDFDVSKAMDDPLTSTKFGKTFNLYPVRFRGYYRYEPGPQMTDQFMNPIEGQDTPALYAVMYVNNGNTEQLNGANVDDSPLVVGRAEIMHFNINTPDWQEFDIPFEFTKDIDIALLKKNGYNLAIVCSSSSGGATYKGAVGSKLFVDELEIVCDRSKTK